MLVCNTLRPGPLGPSHPALQGVWPGSFGLLDLATNALPDSCANVWLVRVEGSHNEQGLQLAHHAEQLVCSELQGQDSQGDELATQ